MSGESGTPPESGRGPSPSAQAPPPEPLPPRPSTSSPPRDAADRRALAVALAPAVLAAAALVLWGSFSVMLPVLPVRLDIMLSSALVLSLMAVLIWGLLPLRRLGRRLPLLAVVALPLAGLFVWLGWVPFANVAKVVGGSGARHLDRRRAGAPELDPRGRRGVGGRRHRERGRRAHQGDHRAGPGGGRLLHGRHHLDGLQLHGGLLRPGHQRRHLLRAVSGDGGEVRPADRLERRRHDGCRSSSPSPWRCGGRRCRPCRCCRSPSWR